MAKFGFMSFFSILFLGLIHFYGLSVCQYIAEMNIPIAFRLFFGGLILILWFGFFTCARVYDPILPGPWTRKETSYWSSLIIEFSISGVVKLLFLIIQIFVFSLLLYLVTSSTLSSLIEIYSEISKGTYAYNRHREYFPLGLLLCLFLLFIFSVIRLLEKLGIIKKIEKMNDNFNIS